jgi:hypothetical protein
VTFITHSWELPESQGRAQTGFFLPVCGASGTAACRAQTFITTLHLNAMLTSIPFRDTMYPGMAYKANSIEELLEIMKRVQGEKTLTEFAAHLEVSKQYLSNVFNRHKEPSERLLEKLGFSRQTMYFRSPAAPRKEKEKEKEKK